MTEQTMPVGGTAVAEPPAPELPFDGSEVSDNGNRKKLLVVGAALGVLVLAVAAFFLTRGGSNPPATNSSAPLPPATSTTTVAHHHKASTNKPVTLPKKYKGHIGRDPFKPLYTEPAAAPSAAPSTGGSTDTTTSTDGSTTPTTSGGTTTTTHTRVYRPIWVQLRSVAPRQATFVIGFSNGKTLRAAKFTVQAPARNSSTVFANTFALLKISGNSVVVKYGDGSPFVLDPQHNTMIVN